MDWNLTCGNTDNKVIYAIGDIHGCLDALLELLARIEAYVHLSDKQAQLVFLGDYIDRGPQSAELVDFFLSGKLSPYNPIFLKGNHEELMLMAIKHAHGEPIKSGAIQSWLTYGGVETLQSYNVVNPYNFETEILNCVSEEHVAFYKKLKTHYSIGDYYFVHAGIRPGIPLEQQIPNDQLWIRDKFLNSLVDHGKVIVHGHTPVGEVEIYPNRIGVDTGAVYGNALSAICLEADKEPKVISVKVSR